MNINTTLPSEMTHKIISNNAYNLIFDKIYLTWASVVFCTLVFDIFNIRLLSKWKFLVKGKYFIIRSICSSSFAIILFSLITNLVAFHSEIFSGHIDFYLKLNLISISAKIISLIIFSIPALFLTYFLKKSEKIDITYDANIFSFNKEPAK